MTVEATAGGAVLIKDLTFADDVDLEVENGSTNVTFEGVTFGETLTIDLNGQTATFVGNNEVADSEEVTFDNSGGIITGGTITKDNDGKVILDHASLVVDGTIFESDLDINVDVTFEDVTTDEVDITLAKTITVTGATTWTLNDTVTTTNELSIAGTGTIDGDDNNFTDDAKVVVSTALTIGAVTFDGVVELMIMQYLTL